MKNYSLIVSNLDEYSKCVSALKLECEKLSSILNKIRSDYEHLKSLNFSGQAARELVLCYETLIKKYQISLNDMRYIIKNVELSYSKYVSIFNESKEKVDVI